jgi:hypothetical protein
LISQTTPKLRPASMNSMATCFGVGVGKVVTTVNLECHPLASWNRGVEELVVSPVSTALIADRPRRNSYRPMPRPSTLAMQPTHNQLQRCPGDRSRDRNHGSHPVRSGPFRTRSQLSLRAVPTGGMSRRLTRWYPNRGPDIHGNGRLLSSNRCSTNLDECRACTSMSPEAAQSRLSSSHGADRPRVGTASSPGRHGCVNTGHPREWSWLLGCPPTV